VLVGEVYHLVSTFKTDLHTSKVCCHSLIKSNTVGSQLSLEVIGASLIRLVVEHPDAVVFSTSGQSSDHTFGDVVRSVHYDEFHC